MSFDENDYSPAHLLGNTNIPRNLYPTLRGSIRRSDPDGGSAVPYFPSTNGKTLRITYTKEVLGVVTDDQVDVAFASNSYTAIIAAINAADSSNVEALDQDGFLVIRNKNQGKTHRLEIEAYTTPSTDDAAPIFGFRVLPFPGSASYAGEISSAPGTRTEQNPQGTALLGGGEDFTSSAFNRSSATILRLMEKVNAELDRDVIVFREAGATFAEHPISAGRWVATFDDPSVRLPIMQMGIQDLLGGTPTPWGTLDALFEIMTLSGGGLSDQETLIATDGTSLRTHQVLQCFYGDNTTALNNALPFATWGTPDGRSIHGTAVPNKDKHATIAITSFDGNIAYCQGATFSTVFVKKNDPVEITNPSSTLPFDHTGWFAVEEVLGEEYLRLRPMTFADKVPATAANQDKPKAINPAGLGDLRVAMGYFIPASSMLIEVSYELVGNHRIRFACGVPLREALAQDFGLQKSGNFNALADELYDHITGAADRHAATQISGFTPANTWRDTSTVAGATLAALINDMIGDLASNTGNGGAARVGAGAISIGGTAPNSIAAGSVNSQLSSLLTTVRDFIADLADTAPAGADLVGSEPHGDLAAGTVLDQLQQLADEWGKLSRAQAWTGLNNFQGGISVDGSSGGDTNANPAILSLGPSGGGVAKLLWSMEASGSQKARLYSYTGSLIDSGVSALAFTVNAYYTTSTNDWAADSTGVATPALIFVLTRNAVIVAIKANTSASWDDTGGWGTSYSLTGAGDLTVRSVTASGTSINSSGAVTVANNQDITLQGTGELVHGDRYKTLSALSMTLDNSSNWTKNLAYVESGAAATAYFTPEFVNGDRITSLQFEFFGNNSTDITITAYVVAAGGTTPIGTTTVNDHANAWLQTTLNVTDTTLAAGEALVIEMGVNASGFRIGNLMITWTHP